VFEAPAADLSVKSTQIRGAVPNFRLSTHPFGVLKPTHVEWSKILEFGGFGTI
jgi:hypothetical protein